MNPEVSMDAVALLRLQLESAHVLADRCLEGLTPEQLHWRPPGTAHPISATYAHMVLSEDWFIQTHLQSRPPLYDASWSGKSGFSALQPEGGAWEEWARTVQVDLSALQAYARAVYAASDAYLAGLKPEDLDREVPFPPGSSMMRSFGQALSSVLIGHHGNHCGEIAAVKGLQGLRGYPF
jgi:hypothetical protein